MEFRGRVGDWIADIRQARERGDTVLFVADSAGRAERTVEILQRVRHRRGSGRARRGRQPRRARRRRHAVARDSASATPALQIYAETDVFEEERRPSEKRRSLAKTFLSDLRDLKVGDLVVHVDHGIGEFVGLKQLGPRGRDGSARSSSSFATTATTSCSSPSNGST